MEDPNRKIEGILDSLAGIKRPEVNPFLFEKIRFRMESHGQEIPKTMVTKWAIALTLMVILNVLTWVRMNSQPETSSDLRTLATEYGFTNSGYHY